MIPMVGLDHKTYKCLPTQIIAQAQFPLAYIFLINTAPLKTLCLSEGNLAKKIV